ncbi:hypothetical protein PUN28_013402 [Cardiocondyla obscurior]|uniref:Uncharacterized protein n=1 Tax=Cardiocondyla obscurior TaxID=286306 RepID=A0AAW2FA85_9HYME
MTSIFGRLQRLASLCFIRDSRPAAPRGSHSPLSSDRKTTGTAQRHDPAHAESIDGGGDNCLIDGGRR